MYHVSQNRLRGLDCVYYKEMTEVLIFSLHCWKCIPNTNKQNWNYSEWDCVLISFSIISQHHLMICPWDCTTTLPISSLVVCSKVTELCILIVEPKSLLNFSILSLWMDSQFFLYIQHPVSVVRDNLTSFLMQMPIIILPVSLSLSQRRLVFYW